ncbi:hypothetical protein OOU_Y34scaffold00889g1 [Pyricularia oryzae Y34]|uniref:Uncharacterized protein n=1 Tax=Pyricularia oryzae (strain Y34) TaxID=1143189 RepID=A0AA97NP07_PYRO3|nr:hypothetical protein OOU_Y34scaffold00889g1 [Pyricularia oryzae Y34]
MKQLPSVRIRTSVGAGCFLIFNIHYCGAFLASLLLSMALR